MTCGPGQNLNLPDLIAGAVAANAYRFRELSAQSSAATSGNIYQISDIVDFAPPWPSATLYLYYGNYFVAAGQERKVANTINISYGTVFRADGTAVPITFRGGGLTDSIAPGSGFWIPVTGPWAAGEKIRVRTEVFTAVGERIPVGYFANLAGSDLGEGRQSGAASDPTKRLAGSLTVGTGNAQAYGPTMAAWSDYDGVTPVILSFDDSRGAGQNDLDYQAAALGAASYFSRIAASTTNGRCATLNISAPGAFAQNIQRDSGARFAALGYFGRRMYQHVSTSLKSNDENNSSVAPTFAQMQSYITGVVAFLRRIKGSTGKIIYAYGFPWLNTDTTGYLYSTLASQVPATTAQAPDGIQQQDNRWIATGILGSDVIPLDLGSVMQDPTDPSKWPVQDVTGTLQTTVSSARTIVVNLPRAPLKGENLVVTVGSPSLVETFHVCDVSGTGPYTVSTAEAVTKTHTAGDVVALAQTRDGVHPGTILNKAAVAVGAAVKLRF